MPPRIGHLKSRGGCRLCKARKVKCTEDKPRCTWCAKRDVPCIYDSPETSLADVCTFTFEPESNPSSNHESDHMSLRVHAGTTWPPLAVLSGGALLPMFLLHHFTSVVVHTFPSEQIPAPQRIYADEMMRMAFECSFLLDAILSVSSFHLDMMTSQRRTSGQPNPETCLIPSTLDSVSFPEVHSLYPDLAARGQRDALSNITAKDAQAIFCTSVMLCISSIQPLRSTMESVEKYMPTIAWLSMSSAIATVALEALPKLPAGSVIENLARADTVPYFLNREDLHHPAMKKSFGSLLTFVDGAYNESSEEQEAYVGALSLIGGAYEAILNVESPSSICRRLMAFGPLAPPLFVTMSDQGRPRAVAILAQFMAMTKIADSHNYWWFFGMAEREVKGLQSLLPAKWQWAVEWPLMVAQSSWDPEHWTMRPGTWVSSIKAAE